MPRRGYRKGISDRKAPKPCIVQTRLTGPARNALRADAAARGLTPSRLVRQLIEAHLEQTRAALPRNTGLTRDFLVAFTRVGNNLNQLARQANVGLVAVTASELRAVLDELTRLAKRLTA